MIPWLACAEPETAWAHFAWTEFAGDEARDAAVIIVPLHGFADHGEGLPLDVEEVVGSSALAGAVSRIRHLFPVRVLPPVRFVLAARTQGFFGLDPETAYAQVFSLLQGIAATGFRKVVLFNTSASSTPLAATLVTDGRVELGLETYLVQGTDLGLRFDSVSDPGADVGRSLQLRLASLLIEIHEHRRRRLPADSRLDDSPSRVGPCFEYPSYRNHYLPALSLSQLTSLPSRSQASLILPIASIEQHGPHLPVGVDAILGQALLAEALSAMPADAPVFVGPSMTYGKSNEHLGFPGTLSVDAKTLRRIVLAIAEQASELGFRHLAVFNTHGGNASVLAYTIPEIREDFGLSASLLKPGYKPELDPQEQAWGMHADDWETSLMLACAPRWVRMEKACREYPAHLDDPGLLRPEKAPAIFGWKTADLSTSGIMGDPTGATREKGLRWLREAGAALRNRLLAEQSERRHLP